MTASRRYRSRRRVRRAAERPATWVSARRPRCIVIGGPNGAGKTTLARNVLLKDAGIVHFVNSDLIAMGLSPLRPDLAVLAAGRQFLMEVDRLAAEGAEFAIESTLSGLTLADRLRRWKESGYLIQIAYVRVPSPDLSLSRVASRVKEGGHNVPAADIVRRFSRSWERFGAVYKPLADEWAVYDNSGTAPKLLEASR